MIVIALTKPILNPIPAYDASNTKTFTFIAQGGSQVIKNQLTIRDNSTNAVVYQKTIETFKFEHDVPGGTLTNGRYYNAILITFDYQNAASTPSDPIQFYCYSTPSIVFTNIPNPAIIEASSFNFQFLYNQTEGELLNSYSVNLYNYEGSLLSTSGVTYLGAPIPPPNSLNYTFYGFNDSTTYKIQVDGITVNNTRISSPLTEFRVVYIIPNVYSVLELNNNCSDGYIDIKTNVSIIEGKSNPSPPIYLNNKEVDLMESGSWVRWDAGFNVPESFTLEIWGRSLTPNSVIATMLSRNNDRVEITYNIGPQPGGGQDMASITVNAYDASTSSNITATSNYINIPDGADVLYMWIRNTQNVFNAYVYNTGATLERLYLVDNQNNKLMDDRRNYLVVEETI